MMRSILMMLGVLMICSYPAMSSERVLKGKDPTKMGAGVIEDSTVTNDASDNDSEYLDVGIYRNPATDELEIDGVPAGMTIRLRDLLGTTLTELVSDGSTMTIDVSAAPGGAYLLVVEHSDGTMMRRVNIVR